MKKTLGLMAIAATAALIQTATPALAKQYCSYTPKTSCHGGYHGGPVQCKTVQVRRCFEVQEHPQIDRGNRVRKRGFGIKRRG